MAKTASQAAHSARHTSPDHARRFARFAPVLLVLLAGCSTAGYPSLARREGEMLAPPAPPARTSSAPLPAASADLAQRLAALKADAAAADAGFGAARPRAETALAAAANAPRGSEAWSLANLALAEMEKARSALADSQAQIEALYAQDRLAHATVDAPDQPVRPDATALAETRDLIAKLADEEDRKLLALRAKLPA